jgi:nucleoside-diphosphate-sugar epimerase
LKNKSVLNISGKTIVITGGSGMAGSAVARALSSINEVKIRLVFRNKNNLQKNCNNHEIKLFDLLNPSSIENPFEGADIAVLCAAETSGAGLTDTIQFDQFLINSRIDINSLKLAAEAGVKKIIYVGTASSYQEHEGYIAENMIDWQKGPSLAHFGVGWSKRVAEQFCYYLYLQKGIEVAVLRLANIYGPFAKFDSKTSNFIPALIRKAVDKLDPFPVWGNPNIKRDILFVDDFASAVIRCLRKTELEFKTFNIGSGSVVSVGEVVKLVLQAANHNPNKIEYENGPKSNLSFRGLSCKKAEIELGWIRTISNEIGLKNTTNWWMDNKETWTK